MEVKSTEFRAKRKFINRVRESRMVSIPPYFLDAMGAMEAKEVIMTVADRDHILLEIVREEDQNEH